MSILSRLKLDSERSRFSDEAMRAEIVAVVSGTGDLPEPTRPEPRIMLPEDPLPKHSVCVADALARAKALHAAIETIEATLADLPKLKVEVDRGSVLDFAIPGIEGTWIRLEPGKTAGAKSLQVRGEMAQIEVAVRELAADVENSMRSFVLAEPVEPKAEGVQPVLPPELELPALPKTLKKSPSGKPDEAEAPRGDAGPASGKENLKAA